VKGDRGEASLEAARVVADKQPVALEECPACRVCARARLCIECRGCWRGWA